MNKVSPADIFSLLTLSQALFFFTCLQYKSFENTAGKGEIARNEQFSFSHSVFYPFWKLPAIFIKFDIVVCILFEFGRVYNLSFGKWLRLLGPYSPNIL